MTRKIVVKPREAESKGADHGQKGNKEDTEESDPEPEPVLTEAPEVPENTEHLKLDVSPDNAFFISCAGKHGKKQVDQRQSGSGGKTSVSI